MIRIALADDHQLFRKSLRLMLESFNGIEVVAEVANGTELPAALNAIAPPDILLLDVHMPLMDGVATATWMSIHHPAVKVTALSMNDDDKMILKMLTAGCCAYLLKDTSPDVLEQAIRQVHEKGYFNGDAANINFRRLLKVKQESAELNVTEKEKQFLQLACSDLTYKQIAHKMQMAERTIDGYRESLFQKLNVQSRVGMALEAIRREIVLIG
jgi:DNA-binding NarL/FixJ family response regulator